VDPEVIGLLLGLEEGTAALQGMAANLLRSQGHRRAASASRRRANAARERAEQYRALLRGEGNGSRPREGAGELGEDGHVGM